MATVCLKSLSLVSAAYVKVRKDLSMLITDDKSEQRRGLKKSLSCWLQRDFCERFLMISRHENYLLALQLKLIEFNSLPTRFLLVIVVVNVFILVCFKRTMINDLRRAK